MKRSCDEAVEVEDRKSRCKVAKRAGDDDKASSVDNTMREDLRTTILQVLQARAPGATC